MQSKQFTAFSALAVVGLTALLATIVTSTLVYIRIVRPFDRLIGHKNAPFNHGIPFVSAALRINAYAMAILREPKKESYDQWAYGDFDFRAHATPGQVRLSKVYLASVTVMGCIGCGVGIYDYWTGK